MAGAMAMFRVWINAHWRRMAMQATLWVLLGVTLGLAALVAHEKRRALRVPMTEPKVFGRLRVCLPRSWSPPSVIPAGPEGGDGLTVEESLPDGVPGRHLTIERSHTGGLVAPLEHLFRRQILSDREFPPAASRAEAPVVQPIRIAGWPGTLVIRQPLLTGPRGRLKKELIACAVVPPSQAVVIKLEGLDAPDAADEELIKQVAETVAVQDAAQPEDGGGSGAVELPGGISAPVPRYFDAVPSNDPNRTSRELLSSVSAGSWAAVELIPCIFLSDDGEEALLTLLAARDREWKPGPIRKTGPARWEVDRVDNRNFPSRACLVANGEDQALLAIFRGDFRDARRFDEAWQALAGGVRFGQHPDLAALLSNGADEVQRLAGLGLDQLIVPVGRQDWALWDQGENIDQLPWMRFEWGLKNPGAAAAAQSDVMLTWEGQRLTIPPDPYEMVASVEQRWSGTSDFARYVSSGSRTAWRGGGSSGGSAAAGRRWDNVAQQVELSDGKLKMAGSSAAAVASSMAAGRAAPPEFIPGGWLPLILGKLSDKPMMLRTESFIGCDATGAPGLLLLTITRPPRLPGTSLQVITVTVNGTGQISRWQYDAGGRLRYIDLAQNLRAQPSEKGLLELNGGR